MTKYFAGVFPMLIWFGCLLGTTELDELYRYTFSREIGYTLVGEKPVSADVIPRWIFPYEPEVFDDFVFSLKNAFDDSDTFVFKVFNSCEGYEVELVNKKALQELVATNSAIKSLIKKNFSSEKAFFEKIYDKNLSVFSFDAYIRGLLFGYGQENSDYFCRLNIVSLYLQQPPSVTYFHRHVGILPMSHEPFLPAFYVPYMLRKPDLRLEFDSLEEELNWLHSIEIYDPMDQTEVEPPYFINLPVYVQRKGAESDKIRTRYTRAKDNLAEIFCGGSYQKAVVAEITKHAKN